MWILLLEACAALFVLLFLVWWTMFSGRDQGRDERTQQGARKEKDTP